MPGTGKVWPYNYNAVEILLPDNVPGLADHLQGQFYNTAGGTGLRRGLNTSSPVFQNDSKAAQLETGFTSPFHLPILELKALWSRGLLVTFPLHSESGGFPSNHRTMN